MWPIFDAQSTFEINRFISVRDNTAQKPPEHLPEEIENAFNEGAACLTIGCNNAAATIFRLCVDLATRSLLPEPADLTKAQPNSRTRRDLGLRLTWLFDPQWWEKFRAGGGAGGESIDDGRSATVGPITARPGRKGSPGHAGI